MKKVSKNTMKILLTIFVIIAVYFFLKIPFVQTMLKIMIFSLLFTYAAKPIHIGMVKNGVKKQISALLLVLVIFLFSTVWLIILIPKFLSEINNLKDIIYNAFLYVDKMLSNIKVLKNNYLFNSVMKKMLVYGSKLVENIVFFIMSFGQNFLTYLIIPIFVYYLLVDGNMFLDKILFFICCKKRKVIKNVLCHIDSILGKYILSEIFLSFLTGFFTYIILYFLNVKGALLLSVFNGILNIVPFFGPVFGAIPAILVALFSSVEKAIWVSFWIILLQQIEGNLISPKVIGNSINMHPVMVIFLLLIGGELAGFLGMLIAIPVGAIIKVIFEDINYYFY